MGELPALGRQLYEGCLARVRVVFLWFEGFQSTSDCGIQPPFISPRSAGSVLTLWIWKQHLGFGKKHVSSALLLLMLKLRFHFITAGSRGVVWTGDGAVQSCDKLQACVLDHTNSGISVCCFQNFFCWSNLNRRSIRGVNQQSKEMPRFAPQLQISCKKPKQTSKPTEKNTLMHQAAAFPTLILIFCYFTLFFISLFFLRIQ